jgi:hypothetical protein
MRRSGGNWRRIGGGLIRRSVSMEFVDLESLFSSRGL